jgi:hypothetical protein
MIDRDARNKLAETLRHLLSGQITNDQFETAALIESDDPIIDAVVDQAWFLYSDWYEHKLTGSHALSKSDRQTVSQFILFLHSELEYEWPRHPLGEGIKAIARPLLYLLSFGLIPLYIDNKWKTSGDFDVWPFIRRRDYEEALNNPKFLRGRAA